MKQVFPPEWRTQNRRKRRFYAKYMRVIEVAGYVVVFCVFAAFIFAFNYPVDDLITADKVPIQPHSEALALETPTLIVRALAKDFDEVQKDQPLLEVVTGEAEIQKFLAWQSVTSMSRQIGLTEEGSRLAWRYPRPALLVLKSPATGTFRFDEATLSKSHEAKAELAKVVAYNDLRLTASLGGQTVSKAKVGQMARVTSIAIDPESGALFRGTDFVSSKLLGESVKYVLQESLVGSGVRLRDDIPLQVSEVSEVQVDAAVKTTPGGDASGSVPLDPPGKLTVEAQVVEGTPMASVQVADLPAAVAEKARKAVNEAVAGKSVRRLDGTVAKLDQPGDVHMVVKLKATRADGSPQTVLNGTMLSRTFDAQLRIPSPPRFLIDAVRSADKAGKPVTARVELRTGTRAIALLLLRKS
jgi:hypothetical protein